MTYYLVDRKYVPNDIYLCYPSNYKQTKQDWKEIQKFVFDNGLEYYIGCNYPMNEVSEGIEVLKNEYNMISQFESPDDLQQYYHSEFEWYRPYKDCEKIWNYYYNNKDLIIDIIKEYQELI